MKTNELFKMDLETGEAEFKQTKEFKRLDSLLRVDIMRDWLYDLKKEYNKALDDFQREIISQ
tara:strand:- start:827 stop:1012 length:186 start_codon:yes stop_codon:yes gene_type:complete